MELSLIKSRGGTEMKIAGIPTKVALRRAEKPTYQISPRAATPPAADSRLLLEQYQRRDELNAVTIDLRPTYIAEIGLQEGRSAAYSTDRENMPRWVI